MSERAICGARVGPVGLGCMNLSHAYGTPPQPAAARRLLDAAINAGVRHFDTAALYGFGRNEELLGEALATHRDRIFLAGKCGMTGIDGRRVIDGRPETLRRTVEQSLQRLRTDRMDLCYLHRIDRNVPVEDSVGELAILSTEGKIGGVGLSEVSAPALLRAHRVCRISAVQSEYSLWSRNADIAVIDACAEIGAAFVAFSPLGRGFLTGVDLQPPTFSDKDIRRAMPRFQPPHFERNAMLLPAFRALATRKGCTPAQLALAWVLGRAAHVHAIPGTTKIAHLHDNIAAGDDLSKEMREQLEQLFGPGAVSGARYNAATQAEIDTEEF